MSKKLSELSHNQSLNETDKLYTVKNNSISGYSTPADVKDTISTDNGTVEKLIKVRSNGDVYFASDVYFKRSDNSLVGITNLGEGEGGGGGDLDTSYVVDNVIEDYIQEYKSAQKISDGMVDNVMLDGYIQNFKYTGLTLINQIVNGNSGLLWYPTGNGTKVKIDQLGKLIENDAYSVSLQNFNGAINDKIFIYVKTSEPVLNKTFGVQYADNTVTNSISAVNNVSEVYGTIQLGKTSQFNPYVLENSASNTTTTTVESFIVVNMTKLGISNLTSLQMADMTRDNYFENIKSISDCMIKCVGKNIVEFGSGKWIKSSYSGISLVDVNDIYTLSTTGSYNAYQIIKVEENSEYYLSGTFNNVTVVISDLSDNVIKTGTGLFNSGDNNEIKIKQLRTSAGTGTVNQLQIEKGNSFTSFEKYKSSNIYINEELKSIGAIKDVLSIINGEVILNKKIEKGFFDSGTQINTTNFPLASTSSAFILIDGNKNLVSGTVNGSYTTSGSGYILYQLYDEKNINLSKECRAVGSLEAYADGHCYLSSYDSGIVGSLSFSVAKNVGAQIKGSAESNRTLSNQLIGIASQLGSIKDFTK